MLCGNWIDNLQKTYKAKITVRKTLTGSFEKNSELDSHSIKILLSKYGFDERLLNETSTSS
jgi:hypothetical protein